jgi:hypothetical protein
MRKTTLRNEPTDEVAHLAQAAREALTDAMVERLAVTAGNTLELLDRLNDERTREAVHMLVDRLSELHKAGALDTLFDAVMLLHAARNAVTDPIVDWRWRRRPRRPRGRRRRAACSRHCRCWRGPRHSAASVSSCASARSFSSGRRGSTPPDRTTARPHYAVQVIRRFPVNIPVPNR